MNPFQIEMHSHKYRHSVSNAKYIVLGTLIFAGFVFVGWVLSTAWGMLEVMFRLYER